VRKIYYLNNLILNISILIVWIAIRISYRDQILHQDEYKWALFLENGKILEFPHPPIAPLLYRTFLQNFGIENLRILPIIISFIGHIVAVALVHRELGKKASLIFNILFTITPFVILGNYQIDIDGSFLFLFVVLYVYVSTMKYRNTILYIFITCVIITLGMLTKFSFILIVVAHLFNSLKAKNREKLRTTFLFLFVSILIFIISRYTQQSASTYSDGFLNSIFSGRNITQIVFLTIKSILWLGPIIFLFSLKAKNGKVSEVSRLLKHYLLILFLFYFIVFNFSERAFDRYLLSFCLPIMYFTVGKSIDIITKSTYKKIILSFTFLTSFFYIVSTKFDLEVIPLHPKEAFLSKLFSMNFNFLIPFFTGSGPIGFYIPFLLIILSFTITFIVLVIPLFEKFKYLIVSVILIYCSFFYVESSSGFFFGNASQIAKSTLSNLPSAVKTITYNDIGGYELYRKGSYFKRLYLNPAWTAVQRSKFENFDGYFMLVNMPDIGRNSWLFGELKNCKLEYRIRDKTISGELYHCKVMP